MENSTMLNQDDLSPVFEEFKARFPDSNPIFIPLLLLSIDTETWKFPEIFHHGATEPLVEYIENSEALRKLMQKSNV